MVDVYIVVEDHDTEYEYEGSDNEEEDESVKPGEPRCVTAFIPTEIIPIAPSLTYRPENQGVTDLYPWLGLFS